MRISEFGRVLLRFFELLRQTPFKLFVIRLSETEAQVRQSLELVGLNNRKCAIRTV